MYFNAGKTRLASFNRLNYSGTTDVKVDGSIPENNYLLRYWDYLSLLNSIGVYTLSQLLKPLLKELVPEFVV